MFLLEPEARAISPCCPTRIVQGRNTKSTKEALVSNTVMENLLYTPRPEVVGGAIMPAAFKLS